MSRLMSVAMTTQAVIERRKTVTRRKGWLTLVPGTRLTLCEKVQGRRKGEPLVRLAEVEVLSVGREPLSALLAPGRRTWAWGEMAREGFPGMDPAEFVDRFFLAAQGMAVTDPVTRIEWRYLDEVAS